MNGPSVRRIFVGFLHKVIVLFSSLIAKDSVLWKAACTFIFEAADITWSIQLDVSQFRDDVLVDVVQILLNYNRYNPTSACVLPKVIKKEIHPLTDQQTAQLLNLLKGSKYELPLTVDLFTGMRELLGLM